ncbi:protein TIFY 5A-like [Musa acuminata AAA Group]|uniref:protein TIFY 5A-like n=1 Tax=Musa acuminata AAA Group TaxID=214697 RepID=UPI0031D6D69D
MKELMEISCDLDLRLRLSSSGSDVCPTDSGTVGSNGLVEFLGKSKESQQQQITLFYNGRICVCNLTDTKARAIISMAKRQMDEQQAKGSSFLPRDPPPSPHPHPHPAEQLLINPGLAMKRSLQLFLQKRKSRLHSLSPYAPCPL